MKVVILGGGFCGALAAKLLDKHSAIEVTLVDKKDFFEYTPSVHMAMFSPKILERIDIPFKSFLKRTRVVTDKLVKVTSSFVETDKEKLFFDYLVISSGIDYPVFLEDKSNVFVLKTGSDAVSLGAKLRDSERVLVIGGGLIGVEVAGELATKFSAKVTVVHPLDRLLERNPQRASSFARRFLERRGVDFIFGEKVVGRKGSDFVTDKGRVIGADIAVWCAGIRCNPWFMSDFPVSVFTDRKALKVNEFLELEGYSNIFVGGDINSVQEEKTAHNAERHARVIVSNILGKRVSYSAHSAPLLISLGDWSAVMSFKGFCFNGFISGLLKHLVERWVLWKYR